MNKFGYGQIVVLAGFALAAQIPPPTSSLLNLRRLRIVQIGFVRDTRAFDGAGCSLWILTDHTYSEGHRVFLSDYEKGAVMNIDGRDTALKLVEFSEAKGAPKKGGLSTYRYRSNGVVMASKLRSNTS